MAALGFARNDRYRMSQHDSAESTHILAQDNDCMRGMLTQDSRPTAVITYSGQETIVSAIA